MSDMRAKPKYKDINDIITGYLEPRLKSECERLGIPKSFIDGIYAIWPKAFEYSSLCEPIERDGKVIAVRIRIDSELRSPRAALLDFWHELWHAKEYYENREISERRAQLYVLKRATGALLGKVGAWIYLARLLSSVQRRRGQ
jgi:hypothetical protein